MRSLEGVFKTGLGIRAATGAFSSNSKLLLTPSGLECTQIAKSMQEVCALLQDTQFYLKCKQPEKIFARSDKKLKLFFKHPGNNNKYEHLHARLKLTAAMAPTYMFRFLHLAAQAAPEQLIKS